jgi:acetyl esterase/lipase
MKHYLYGFLLLAFVACKKKEEQPLPADYTKTTIAYKQINGVDANLLSLDIYAFTPKPEQPKPVVIYVHGGAWAVGDKGNSISNKVNLCNSLGYVFVSINYRLSPNPAELTNPNRVMFPLHNLDVADAVKWVHDNIAQYGGDKQKMVLMGHSAGGHLTALTSVSSQFLPALGLPVNTLKGAAVIDTEGYDVTVKASEGEVVYLNAFGNNTQTWKQASPTEQLVQGTAYPAFFVAKRGANTRIAQADAFINKLQSVGGTVTHITANQYDHEGINDAIGAPNETAVTEPLKAFFRQCFE